MCKGKWYKYRAKEDNGFCRSCVKTENQKSKLVKIDKNRHYIYDCRTTGCAKDLRIQKTDYC